MDKRNCGHPILVRILVGIYNAVDLIFSRRHFSISSRFSICKTPDFPVEYHSNPRAYNPRTKTMCGRYRIKRYDLPRLGFREPPESLSSPGFHHPPALEGSRRPAVLNPEDYTAWLNPNPRPRTASNQC